MTGWGEEGSAGVSAGAESRGAARAEPRNDVEAAASVPPVASSPHPPIPSSTRPASDKVLDRAAVAELAAAARAEGRAVVLTNGVFDLLHVGHLRYLEAARGLGDLLIVGVNSDASTRALKGPERPLVPEGERAELVAGLACVDAAVVFPEPTAAALVEAIRPAVWVKGGDYGRLAEALPRLPEAAVVRRLGGEVRLLPFVEGRSTTRLVARIRGGGTGDGGMRGAQA